MSWSEYVEKQLIGTGAVTSGAILGHDGSIWAQSANFKIQGSEGAALNALIGTPAPFESGIMLGGVKYMCIKSEERSLYGKKGAAGVVIVRTGQAIIVATYDENLQPGQCTLVVEKLADYLVGAFGGQKNTFLIGKSCFLTGNSCFLTGKCGFFDRKFVFF
eukprot:TRINITY_DN6659_c0_g1_i2.p1 TRINITY_DN6659_c0_g1~~TRINITY_DN6659_c0_g1_i2.p1  ORF type:complete len:187 (+),score=64.47 TRINITY_DN6659_c0_g1_i2:81-563(+)